MSAIVTTVLAAGTTGVAGALALVVRTHTTQLHYLRDLDAGREPSTRLGRAIRDRDQAGHPDPDPDPDLQDGPAGPTGPAGAAGAAGGGPWEVLPVVRDRSVLGDPGPTVLGTDNEGGAGS